MLVQLGLRLHVDGLIEKVGTVKRVSRGRGLVLEFSFAPWSEPLEPGESVAVNGVCLTVAQCDATRFTADVLRETESRTGLAELNKIHPLDYWRTVTHQCSCIWLFPHTLMMPPMTPKQAQKRSEKLAKEIGLDVLTMAKTEKNPPRNVLNAAENAGWPMISKKKAEGFRVSDACIGCGQCVKLCPRGNIRLENGRAVIGTNCAQCLGCLQFCPTSAISLGSVTDKREHYHNPNVKAADLMEKVIHID